MRKGLTCSEAGKLGAIAASETISFNKQKRIDIYYQNPILCKYCNLPIPYEKRFENKFCNHVCSASFNSPNIIHNIEKPYNKNCLVCDKLVKNGSKFCDTNCLKISNWENIKSKILQDGYDTSYSHHNAKKYLIELNKGICQICGLSEWNNQPMPLVLDHISGNSDDGNLSNLRVICNNCDALTPTYKAKNKGNGRTKRREKYKERKNY